MFLGIFRKISFRLCVARQSLVSDHTLASKARWEAEHNMEITRVEENLETAVEDNKPPFMEILWLERYDSFVRQLKSSVLTDCWRACGD